MIDGQIYNMAPPSPLHQELMELRLSEELYQKGGNCKVYPAPFAVLLRMMIPIMWSLISTLSVIHVPLTPYLFCEGAPDFIIEIVSPSSRKMDYSTKNTLYTDAGVSGVLIVDPAKERTTVYHDMRRCRAGDHSFMIHSN